MVSEGKACRPSNRSERWVGELVVSPQGEVFSPWWTEAVDEVLAALGVPQDDPNRNPWCG